MDSTLRVKSLAFNPQLLEDIKQQVGQMADVEIRIHSSESTLRWLTEDQFWSLIATLDWSKTGDDDAVVEPVIEALIGMPVANIYKFQDYLSEKLWLLDTRQHAEASSEETDTGISSDVFLYDRCCVVANGKEFYESVLQDPSLWPKGYSFESLLNVASDAYERKTGNHFTYYSTYNYETGSNETGWNE